MTRHVLVQDDSCHWYVISADRQEEWFEWVEDEDNDDVPDYAVRVGGSVSLVQFGEYTIG